MSSLGGQPDFDGWWRGLDVPGDPSRFSEFVDAEFPAAADPGGINRRRWLQLMGASLALAAAGGCRWETQEIRPFVERPEGRVPGKTERLRTAMPLGDAVVGLEVTCVDGRPIKIEGNPLHPASLGATDVFAQAALLELYDPDRSQSPALLHGKQVQEKTWQQFDEALAPLARQLHETGGEGFRVLAEASCSPTLLGLRSRLLKTFPKARWFEYEPLGDDNVRAGAIRAFGRPLRTHLRLDRARVIVCLDADPIGDPTTGVRYARDLMAGRQPESGAMSRLYVIESGMSLTGTVADHRLPVRPSEMAGFVAQLQSALAASKTNTPDSPLSSPFLRAVVDDLLAEGNHGRSVVCVGPSQPPEVHAAVHRINEMLGNVGENGTIAYSRAFDPERPLHVDAMRTLVDEMNAGKVHTLLILGGNPVYNAPADLAFADALKRVETSIHLSSYRDETSRRCTWHLPHAHFLEAWGDGRAYDGTYSVMQPMIAPLRNGRSPLEALSMVLSAIEKTKTPAASPEELVRRTFREQIAAKSGPTWEQTIRDGLLADSRWPTEKVSLASSTKTAGDVKPKAEDKRAIEAIFVRDRSVYDGRFANNSWLQEWPDPVTRLTWGGAALIGPATAETLGIRNGEIAVVKLGERRVRIPFCVLPGQAAGTVSLPLGYGRVAAGKVGGDLPEVEPVGVDVYPLRTTTAMHVAAVTVTPTGEIRPLAGTQDHFAIDAVGREATEQRAKTLIRQASLHDYRQHPELLRHADEHPPLESLWQEHEYQGHRWAMAIDLTKCIGCGSCVVACQAENNIPVVGRAQVLKNREMHWLRVDRYFRDGPDDPEVAYQPLPCQQCELAPCEQVCPVAATVHSHEGLNDMTYNRCVGIRYCANNCPYKVRRFNFFNYHKEFEKPENEIAKMKYNPEVTVRTRGVMEKCTYCVQRIQNAKIGAKTGGEPLRDGQIQTACQQACPAGAIVFGDLADKESQVSRWQQSARAYAILAELNTKPRTVYLAKIGNPNPALHHPHADS
jgi:Fe-S-cluster-containing dehydrogenase component/anaerobic selenocysteine-containing dehydrogenase